MSQRTIIIADDEAFLTQLLSYNIQKSGAEVFVVRNGLELCALAESKRPDLIITDYQMPVMDGLTACKRLKQNPTTADIPILMLTARGHRMTGEELSQTNIRLLLPKPFSMREVMVRIEEMLNASVPGASEPADVGGPAK
ncbi:MAG TPA: response regulator [Tepidisphaeraceae bacterium]|jgi:DNA-binding response OmpR family regulator|nr:response regulator [Tepidisphaeraceae bacterium]